VAVAVVVAEEEAVAVEEVVGEPLPPGLEQEPEAGLRW
jgi:hypothetical protein